MDSPFEGGILATAEPEPMSLDTSVELHLVEAPKRDPAFEAEHEEALQTVRSLFLKHGIEPLEYMTTCSLKYMANAFGDRDEKTTPEEEKTYRAMRKKLNYDEQGIHKTIAFLQQLPH